MRSRPCQIEGAEARSANPPLTLQGTGVVIAAIVTSFFCNVALLWLGMPSLIHSRGLSLHPLVPFLALALERRQWQTNRLDLSLIAAPRINIEWADSTRLLPVLELSPSALPAFSVGPLPTVAYVPDYLTAGEEASLLREIRSTQRWTEVRRLAAVH